ncbi:MAG TPA: hypothetical protein VIL04_11895 [Solirubrobacterales bacterium]|jgi:glutamate formiminotransferase/glutamate formiminotransferase/formiminotetrahydrofolate cyclodeaminase
MPTLLAVPNVSEGRDESVVAELAGAFSAGIRLLDRHSDPTHNRSVFTLAGPPGALAEALAAGARATVEAIDMREHEGAHPCVGALDVCPVVFLGDADIDLAETEARTAAEAIAALGVPVFFYGELARNPARRERAFYRRGGLAELARRMVERQLHPDLGPRAPHPTAGATLVTARPPLAAFNLELSGATLQTGRAIARALRESGGGLPGVRAIALELDGGAVQVSTNVHDPVALPLAQVTERVAQLAALHDARVAAAEIVGLVPEAALEGFPEDLPIRGFDRERGTIEARLRDAQDG